MVKLNCAYINYMTLITINYRFFRTLHLPCGVRREMHCIQQPNAMYWGFPVQHYANKISEMAFVPSFISPLRLQNARRGVCVCVCLCLWVWWLERRRPEWIHFPKKNQGKSFNFDQRISIWAVPNAHLTHANHMEKFNYKSFWSVKSL